MNDAPIVLSSFGFDSVGHRIDRRSDGMTVLICWEGIRDVVIRQHHTRTFTDVISRNNLTYVHTCVCVCEWLIIGVEEGEGDRGEETETVKSRRREEKIRECWVN